MYGDNKRLASAGELEFEHPILESIMKETHGCLVYQEQLMQVCQYLGKMEFKDVQRVRKVLLKKDKSKTAEFLKKENDELKAKFLKGCLENGLTEARAEEWWKNLLFFGGYGFNCLFHHTLLNIKRNNNFLNITIEEVRIGDIILSRDEHDNSIIEVVVKDVFDNGKREMFEFELDDGKKVTCTMDHKFRTTTGQMLPIKEIMEKNLEIVCADFAS
jgi:DNA polymerase-3 subunit alpha